MVTKTHQTVHGLLKWTTLSLGMFCVAVVALGMSDSDSFQALLVKKKTEYPWKVITAQQVMSGTTVPADTNVIFHLPENFERISREILLGHKGKSTRYWGYCIPSNYSEDILPTRNGFPGLIFLSEQERLAREEAAIAAKPRLRVSNLPSDEEIKAVNDPKRSQIRHQLEVFKPATMCYIMSEKPLAIGLDPDNDRLNSKLEMELGTDPTIPDTDGDGLRDGIEYVSNTNALIRDTDSDGLIDGIEDADWDGNIDQGETDPRTRDTDRDGLCDGMCRTRLQDRTIFIGEDQNLNGTVDGNETDPLKTDTDGDGLTDELELLRCIAANRPQCP